MKQILVVLLLCGAMAAQQPPKRARRVNSACARLASLTISDGLRKSSDWLDFAAAQEKDASLEKLGDTGEVCIDSNPPKEYVAIATNAVFASAYERGRRSAAQERAGLVTRVVEEYNGLVGRYNELLATAKDLSARPVPVSAPTYRPLDPALTPRQPLNCTAMRLGSNITTLSCY